MIVIKGKIHRKILGVIIPRTVTIEFNVCNLAIFEMLDGNKWTWDDMIEVISSNKEKYFLEVAYYAGLAASIQRMKDGSRTVFKYSKEDIATFIRSLPKDDIESLIKEVKRSDDLDLYQKKKRSKTKIRNHD